MFEALQNMDSRSSFLVFVAYQGGDDGICMMHILLRVSSALITGACR